MFPETGVDNTRQSSGLSPTDEYFDGFRIGADVAKYFVEAGNNFLDLLMRCNFRNDRVRIATCELAGLYIKYGLKDKLAILTMNVASSDSVNAMRIERFLAGVTGGASRTKDARGPGIFDLKKYTEPKNGNTNQ